jgi:hypothetical protein
MDRSMSFNPEHGFYPWMATVAYILDVDVRSIEKDADGWRPYFDKGVKPSAAITARQNEETN